MKTVVISGAKSNVGKTTLAEEFSRLLPGSVYVKLGHGEMKEDMENVFYRAGTRYSRIEEENRQADFLIIESNRILEEIEPDLTVYLPAEDPKPSAALAETRADLIRGCKVSDDIVRLIAGRLGIGIAVAGKMARLICGSAGRGDDGK